MDAHVVLVNAKSPMFSISVPEGVPSNLPEIHETGPFG